MIIRKATHEDLPRLLELARAMHAESNYSPEPFDDGMCGTFLEMVVSEDQYVALVAEKKGEVIGAMLGILVPFFFSVRLRASDIAFYVLPAHRGSMAAPMLMLAYEDRMRQKGAVKFYQGVTTNVDTQRSHEFFLKMGYTHIGGFYAKES